MPELPEVEVLVRHLRPLLVGVCPARVALLHPKTALPTRPNHLLRALESCRILSVERRGKFMVFRIAHGVTGVETALLGHLGMTGRMFLQPVSQPVPPHAVVTWEQAGGRFVFTDVRKFGRLTLCTRSLDALGPEPLTDAFSPHEFEKSLRHSRQSVKVRLLDQAVVAGVGNIYASEILFRSGVRPSTPCFRLSADARRRIHGAIRTVLSEAVDLGVSLSLRWDSSGSGDGIFYYGSDGGGGETFAVYGRAGQACGRCGALIRRQVHAGRSSFFCPGCQV